MQNCRRCSIGACRPVGGPVGRVEASIHVLSRHPPECSASFPITLARLAAVAIARGRCYPGRWLNKSQRAFELDDRLSFRIALGRAAVG
jgi:hypothetical protein